MTQFLYVTGPLPDLAAFPGIRAERAVGIGVRGVEALLPPEDLLQTWELVTDDADSEVGDEWIGEAESDMVMIGKQFHETMLGMFLMGYVGYAIRITISNAEESVDDVTFRDEREFIRYVGSQVGDYRCDAKNARFVRRG